MLMSSWISVLDIVLHTDDNSTSGMIETSDIRLNQIACAQLLLLLHVAPVPNDRTTAISVSDFIF